ncbi:MAG: hypothetical protein NVSMB27_23450 [Ktedonobacteraceae bacterium]
MNLPLPEEMHTRLRGHWLLAAKAVWLMLAACAFVMFVIALPGRFIQLTHPTSVVQTNLAYLKLPIGFYAGYNLLFEGTFIVCCLTVALFLFWRKSDEPMAFFVALFLVAFGITMPPTVFVLATSPVWRVVITGLNILGWASLSLFILLFPNGRFEPRWMRWSTPWFILYVLLWHLPGALPFHPSHWPPPLIAFTEISAVGILGGGRYLSLSQGFNPTATSTDQMGGCFWNRRIGVLHGCEYSAF